MPWVIYPKYTEENSNFVVLSAMREPVNQMTRFLELSLSPTGPFSSLVVKETVSERGEAVYYITINLNQYNEPISPALAAINPYSRPLNQMDFYLTLTNAGFFSCPTFEENDPSYLSKKIPFSTKDLALLVHFFKILKCFDKSLSEIENKLFDATLLKLKPTRIMQPTWFLQEYRNEQRNEINAIIYARNYGEDITRIGVTISTFPPDVMSFELYDNFKLCIQFSQHASSNKNIGLFTTPKQNCCKQLREYTPDVTQMNPIRADAIETLDEELHPVKIALKAKLAIIKSHFIIADLEETLLSNVSRWIDSSTHCSPRHAFERTQESSSVCIIS